VRETAAEWVTVSERVDVRVFHVKRVKDSWCALHCSFLAGE
jgi:hypothetical protein